MASGGAAAAGGFKRLFAAFKESRAFNIFVAIGSKYNQAVQESPIITKSLTSGVMYGAGDLICQVGESYHNGTPLNVDWKRTAVFGTFGTVFSGPLYHYWFGYLDTLPIRMFEMRKQRQRWKILRAYNVLKANNVPIGELVLPDTKPFHKYTIKAVKICMDQLIFSSLYTFSFFIGIGVLNELTGVSKAKHAPAHSEPNEVIASLNRMKTDNNAEAIDNIIKKLTTENDTYAQKVGTAFKHAWEHTKKIYVPTYIADCIVWPPLQLVNFTFVPLNYQVLYVNACNLLWNTFLSFMANGGH